MIACAMDGTTARRMAEQLGGTTPALTVEQLKVRLQSGRVQVDERTVIFVDEASKLDTGHWAELAAAVEHHGARLRAVGHDGQHDAIRLPGLFSEMLRDQRIPTAELLQIRRHRNPANLAEAHPWLRDYQIAVDQGRGADAIAILQEQDALKLYDSRAQAMGGMVDEWARWRHDYELTESALIVHGPNPDVDLVNALAQHVRHEAGELGQQAIRAVDRDYLIHPGDLVAVRNAAYTFPAQPGRPRPQRIENGQTAIVESVDPERDTLALRLHEPGAEPRLVEIDHARLRSQHAADERTAAIRLNYAMHSFPAQGATVHGTATLAGHWSQAKQETYVGDTRAIYRHTVHLAREDLGTDGTDEDRINRYAQRISENRQRHASIRFALDPTMQLAVPIPGPRPLRRPPAQNAESGPHTPASLNASTSMQNTSTATTAPTAGHETRPESSAVCMTGRPQRVSPTEHLLGVLGPVPGDRIARERWEREARRLEALRPQTHIPPQPSPSAPLVLNPAPANHAPTSPPLSQPQRGRPAIGR
jgi:hypothetical protein